MSYKIKKDGEWVTVANGSRMFVGSGAAIDAAIARGELKYPDLYACTDDYPSGVGAIAVKQVRIPYADMTAGTTYGDFKTAKVSSFYNYCGIPSTSTIINVVANNNAGDSTCPLIVRDASASNNKPYTAVGFASALEQALSANGYVEVKVFYIDYNLGTGV